MIGQHRYVLGDVESAIWQGASDLEGAFQGLI